MGKSFGVFKLNDRSVGEVDVSIPRRDSNESRAPGNPPEGNPDMTVTEAAGGATLPRHPFQADALVDPFNGHETSTCVPSSR